MPAIADSRDPLGHEGLGDAAAHGESPEFRAGPAGDEQSPDQVADSRPGMDLLGRAECSAASSAWMQSSRLPHIEYARAVSVQYRARRSVVGRLAGATWAAAATAAAGSPAWFSAEIRWSPTVAGVNPPPWSRRMTVPSRRAAIAAAWPVSSRMPSRSASRAAV